MVLNFLREIVIRDRLCTFVGGAKSYVLKANQLVDHFHGDVGVLIRVEEAVVIVAEVVDELAGVGVGDGGQFFGVIEPVVDEVLAVFGGGSEDEEEEEEKGVNFHELIDFLLEFNLYKLMSHTDIMPIFSYTLVISLTFMNVDSLQHLESEFEAYLAVIHQNINPHTHKSERIRLNAWIKKLCSVIDNVFWRKNRNFYAEVLACMLLHQQLGFPFNKPPPEDSLPKLTPYEVPFSIRQELSRQKASQESNKENMSEIGNTYQENKLKKCK